jgi:hypothetical protein
LISKVGFPAWADLVFLEDLLKGSLLGINKSLEASNIIAAPNEPIRKLADQMSIGGAYLRTLVSIFERRSLFLGLILETPSRFNLAMRLIDRF